MSAAITALSRRSLVFLTLCATLVASGCAYGPTPYQPASDGGYGYREQKIENNRYRITFAGNSATSRETVENYLLYRAAEVTLDSGNDYFIVVTQETDATERAVGVYSGYYHPGLHYRIYGPRGYWHRGYYYQTDTYTIVTRYEASAEITVHEGEKPEDDPSAYDARQVIENLGPTIRRPDDSPRLANRPAPTKFHK